jgi:hypothetical protein
MESPGQEGRSAPLGPRPCAARDIGAQRGGVQDELVVDGAEAEEERDQGAYGGARPSREGIAGRPQGFPVQRGARVGGMAARPRMGAAPEMMG